MGSRLKRLEIRNSHFEGSGPAYADYVYIADSRIYIRIPETRFVHLKNNEYLNDREIELRSSGVGDADTIVMEGCRKATDWTLFKSKITNMYINDCALKDPYLEGALIGFIQLCNVQIRRDMEDPVDGDLNQIAWDNASIREAQFHNVQFTGPFPVKGFTIGHLQTENSQLPAELIRAAKQHSPLSGGCPPLPDTEALKQKALSSDPPPPLSGLLQERFSDP